MDSLGALLEERGASRIVAEAWPGAKFCGARCSELTQDMELKATIRGDLPAALVVINGAIVRWALRSGEVGPLMDAVDQAVRMLAERVHEIGHMDAMRKLDPGPRIK